MEKNSGKKQITVKIPYLDLFDADYGQNVKLSEEKYTESCKTAFFEYFSDYFEDITDIEYTIGKADSLSIQADGSFDNETLKAIERDMAEIERDMAELMDSVYIDSEKWVVMREKIEVEKFITFDHKTCDCGGITTIDMDEMLDISSTKTDCSTCDQWLDKGEFTIEVLLRSYCDSCNAEIEIDIIEAEQGSCQCLNCLQTNACEVFDEREIRGDILIKDIICQIENKKEDLTREGEALLECSQCGHVETLRANHALFVQGFVGMPCEKCNHFIEIESSIYPTKLPERDDTYANHEGMDDNRLLLMAILQDMDSCSPFLNVTRKRKITPEEVKTICSQLFPQGLPRYCNDFFIDYKVIADKLNVIDI